MAQITVLDSSSVVQTVAKVTNTGTTTMTNALPVTIATDDTIISATNTKLDQLHTDLTASNLQLPTTIGTQAAAASLSITWSTENSARLPAALGQGTTAQSLKVCLPNDQAGAPQVTITRPANTTAYTAGDVLGGVQTFATGLTSGQNIMITGADLLPEIASIPSGMTTFRLYLYDATPVSAIADNGAWTFTSTDWPNFLGYIDLGAPVDLGAGLFCQVDGVNKKIKLNASANLFGYLVTTGGFTPAANSEVYLIRLQLIGV